jgi:hypothetical protein
VARLVDDCHGRRELPAVGRVERVAAARAWLASIALPAMIRAALTRLAEATSGELADVDAALKGAITAVDQYLDAPSRAELGRLSQAFESDR